MKNLRNKTEIHTHLLPVFCSTEDCDREAKVRGMCEKHYNKWSKSEDFILVNPNKHRISEIDEENLRAICKECGPVDLHKMGFKPNGTRQYGCAIGQKTAKRKHYFGIDENKYQEILLKQGGLCATGCGRNIKGLDHDHTTGKIREFLCHNCNVSLGLLDDSIEQVELLLKYLRKHKNGK